MKMYNQPKTDVTIIATERLMDSFGASPQGPYQGSESGIPDTD